MHPGKIAALLAAAAAGAVLLCSTAASQSYPPMPEALEALESDDTVTVTRDFVWSALSFNYFFEPSGSSPVKGFIFYPGGLVDAQAYAPPLRAIAGKGYLTVIVEMPFDIAFLGLTRASAIIRQHPGIETWAIGGHSLGGVVSCGYTRRYPGSIDGVVLWASYPSDTFRIDDKDVRAISIYGSNDGLTTIDEIGESEQHLPAGTQFFEIEGGNHTQFGWYGDGEELQEGDNPAGITREEQQEQIVEATSGFLDLL